MADIKTPEQRSYNMAAIKGKNTKPETILRKYLFSEGFRYRKNDKRYPGTPDVVLPKYKTMIFVNGCFWHGHEGCKYFVWPKNNEEFWLKKITANIERDRRDFSQLEALGWNVIVIWECQLKPKTVKETLENLKAQLKERVTK